MDTTEKNHMQAMRVSSHLFGLNGSFIEGLYEDYLANPSSIPAEWRTWLDSLQDTKRTAHEVAHNSIRRAFAALPQAGVCGPHIREANLERKQAHMLQLINAHRFLGVRVANLDPLNRYKAPSSASMLPRSDPSQKMVR
jgi:2-oxoglutarate dehydrogenase E1 component